VSESVSEFWDLLHISGTVEARNFKFGKLMSQSVPMSLRWSSYVAPKSPKGGLKNAKLGVLTKKNAKLGQKGSWRGHVTYFMKFWDPVHISRTVEARNFKFGRQIRHWVY